jgi:hypothetical protein
MIGGKQRVGDMLELTSVLARPFSRRMVSAGTSWAAGARDFGEDHLEFMQLGDREHLGLSALPAHVANWAVGRDRARNVPGR